MNNINHSDFIVRDMINPIYTVFQFEQTLSYIEVCHIYSMQTITEIVKEIVNEYDRLMNIQESINNDYKNILNAYKDV